MYTHLGKSGVVGFTGLVNRMNKDAELLDDLNDHCESRCAYTVYTCRLTRLHYRDGKASQSGAELAGAGITENCGRKANEGIHHLR